MIEGPKVILKLPDGGCYETYEAVAQAYAQALADRDRWKAAAEAWSRADEIRWSEDFHEFEEAWHLLNIEARRLTALAREGK